MVGSAVGDRGATGAYIGHEIDGFVGGVGLISGFVSARRGA